MEMNDEYFKRNFNTVVPENKVEDYQRFLADYGKSGRALSYVDSDYDMAGYFMSGGSIPKDGKGHFPDTYKKPNHPTFSNQSQYHNTQANGVNFIGGSWSKDNMKYTPSPHQSRDVQSLNRLQDYFSKAEIGRKVIIPTMQNILNKGK